MLPSIPVSILYGIGMLFLPTDVFKFAISTEQFLLKYTELNIHHFKIIPCILLDGLLFHLVDCPAFLTSAYSAEMANLAALCACLSLCWTLPWWMCTATVSYTVVFMECYVVQHLLGLLVCTGLDTFILLNSFGFSYCAHYSCLGPLCFYPLCPC